MRELRLETVCGSYYFLPDVFYRRQNMDMDKMEKISWLEWLDQSFDNETGSEG